jgi:hypothetical protein
MALKRVTVVLTDGRKSEFEFDESLDQATVLGQIRGMLPEGAELADAYVSPSSSSSTGVSSSASAPTQQPSTDMAVRTPRADIKHKGPFDYITGAVSGAAKGFGQGVGALMYDMPVGEAIKEGFSQGFTEEPIDPELGYGIPNFMADVMLDPTTYVAPEVKLGKYLTKMPKWSQAISKYAVEPTLEAGAASGIEVAGKEDVNTQDGLISTGIGGVLGGAGRGVLSNFTPAVRQLEQRMKLPPSKYSDVNVEMLLQDGIVPNTGNNSDIFEALSTRVDEVGRGRDAVLNNMEKERTNTIASKFNPLELKIFNLYEKAKTGVDVTDELKTLITTENIGFDDVADIYTDVSRKMKSSNVPVTKFDLQPTEIAITSWEELQKIANDKRYNATEKAKIKEIVDNEIKDLMTGGANIKDLIKRRQMWAQKGKMGNKEFSELNSMDQRAYQILSGIGSSILNKVDDKALAPFNEQFSKYLPTLNAMEDKAGAWANNSGSRFDVMKPGTWIDPITNSNAYIKSKYALEQGKGKLQTPFINTPIRPMIPGITSLQQQTSEEEQSPYPAFDSKYKVGY